MVEHTTDPGFGSKSVTSNRLINESGRYNIKRKGRLMDLYKYFVEIPLYKLVIYLFVSYILLNVFFAVLFFAYEAHLHFDGGKNGISGFLNCLYFSFQTFTTVGYGHYYPNSAVVNIICAIEAYTGLVFFAIATGLSFSRFSSPGRYIMFSDIAIIRPFNESNALMLRAANRSNSKMVDVTANVMLTYVDIDQPKPIRRYITLPLQIDKIVLFPLNWTIVHPINKNSWLFGKSTQDLIHYRVEILVILRGHDETYSQTVMANRSYTPNQIEWNVAFDLMYEDGEHQIVLDLGKINDTHPIDSK